MDQKEILEVQLMSKSAGMAALLGAVLGGFGLFYVSTLNGLVGAVIEVILLVLVLATAGFGVLLLVPWHIVCALVGMSMANSHNKRLLKRVANSE